MGKQAIPKKRVKLDKGPDNVKVAVKRSLGKNRFTVKRGMKKVRKVSSKSEPRKAGASMSFRTDIGGKRVTPNHSKMTL